MITKLVKKVVGSRNERLLKQYRKVVKAINALEPELQALTDEDLQAKTGAFKARYQAGETLDQLLPEAFAVVREASQRTLKMRHFDVQLIGGLVLHYGKVAEMRTGEGKTLTSTLAVYLNSLTGGGVHLITVNDYLAERDANWMRPVLEFLGLTVGINLTNMDHAQKQAAYAADITYGTNNEFGFDYLRDNMAYGAEQLVQRPLAYAIIDEVDSILIDEARTPLIISGQVEETTDLYLKLNTIVPQLKRQMVEEDIKEEVEIAEEDRGDYYVDEKNKQVSLTEQGHQHLEALLHKAGLLAEGSSLYDLSNVTLMHYVNAALRAYSLFNRDVEYIVKDDEVVIVDEHTGRLMEGRRWSDGLHQAVEAKEGVAIQMENQTMATITFQNYFRLYQKLSGMTGTADTEAFELAKIYGLEVVVLPTNKPMVRDDRADMIFITATEKYDAIIKDIKQCAEKNQPVLVGTASVESSELISALLKKEKIKHSVLNAKQHEREAGIIVEAGVPGTVTIATNMAGRGTDIVLGGNWEAEIAALDNPSDADIDALKADWKKRHDAVIAAGGLHVVGTERNESRRVDNQLRGRSGRQGDAGSSQFYLSLDDNLLRIFAIERMAGIMRKLGIEEGESISHRMVTNNIEKAQRRVEGMNFDIRKQLLEFDDVANDQRKVVYSQRRELLDSSNVSEVITRMRDVAVGDMITTYVPTDSVEEEWNVKGLENRIAEDFGLKLAISDWLASDDQLHEETLRERILLNISEAYAEKEAAIEDPQALRDVEKSVILQVLDTQWREHLAAMEHLRQGIHLRGYAQKNPAQEYKRESFDLFTDMLMRVKYEVVSTLSRVQLAAQPEMLLRQPSVNLSYQHHDMTAMPAEPEGENDEQADQKPFVRDMPKVGRNEPCPCGSGKKYKQCHGALSTA